jgi:hypothetical protein
MFKPILVSTLVSAIAGLTPAVQAQDVPTPNLLKREVFLNELRQAVLDGTAGDPDLVTAVGPAFEGPAGFGDNYTQRISGFFTPAETGTYVFFLAADDDADLFLSTDDNPANKKLIAQESGWSQSRFWVTVGGGSIAEDKRSDLFAATEWPEGGTINLTANRRYYIEAVQHEGGGGDNLAVHVQRLGEDDPTNGSAPGTSGGTFSFNAPPSTITITTQPANANVIEGNSATLSVAATTTSAFGIAGYQWKRNGTAIAGATAATYTTPFLGLNDGASYTVDVSAAGSGPVTSQAAQVTVVADTVPPTAISAVSMTNGDNNTTEIGIIFNEALTVAGAETTANYTLSAASVTGARHVPNSSGVASIEDGVILTVTGLTPGATLTIRNVADAKGNAIPAAGQAIAVGASPLSWISIGRDGEAADARPFEPAAIAVSANGFNLVSGGQAFWGNSDDITLVYEEITGDFDKKARVAYADPSSQWSRNGITVRASLNNGTETTGPDDANPASIYQNSHVNPPIMFNGSASNNSWETNRRLQAGGATSGSGGGGTPAYPNAWVRIKRVDQRISMYRANGEDPSTLDWTPLGTTLFNEPDVSDELPARTFVGVFDGPENGNITGIDPDAPTEWANQIRDYGDTVATQKARGKQTYSIGLNLGANESGAQIGAVDVAGANGVAQGNWNNLYNNNTLDSGPVGNIVADKAGVSTPTQVTVEFDSPNTWESTGRGEENNDFTAPDSNLMTGYLDTGGATTTPVTISNIPSDLTGPGYDVVVYYLGGIAGDRGGAYRITDASGNVLADYIHALGTDTPPEKNYVLNDGAPGSTEYKRGNVLVFRNLKADKIIVEATTADGKAMGGTPRAPLNAIQLLVPTGLDVIGESASPGASFTSVARQGDNLVLTWASGTLESADIVIGPWTAVPNATSPITFPFTGTAKFYRLR